MKKPRSAPELSIEEKKLLIEFEHYLRDQWSANLNGQMGGWGQRKLLLPTKPNAVGKPRELTLTIDTSNEDFFESCCIHGDKHFHTVYALYALFRDLKKRGLLNVQGFECSDATPPSKPQAP